MIYRRYWRLAGSACWARSALLWLLLALLAAGCGAAVGRRLLLDDPSGQLDRARVEAATRPLLERGAALAVIVVPAGDTGADFTRRLDAAGLLRGGRIAPEAIALYVSFAPRYSELRAGTNWSAQLPNETLREIRLVVLNPALRTGAATEGVSAALAELDTRIAAGPLAAWGSRWLWFGGLVFALALILGYRRLGGWAGSLWRTWLSSRLGRLIARLWEHSPPGRASARRRLAQQIDWARQRLARSAAEARSHLADAAPSMADLAARLQELDRRDAALGQPATVDPELLSSLNTLDEDYRHLSTDIATRLRELRSSSAKLDWAAKQARELVERVAVIFDRPHKVPKAWRKTAGKLKREYSEAARKQLDSLLGTCQQLDQQRVALEKLDLPSPELIERQRRLASDYDVLRQAAAALWQAEAPWAYQAYLAAQAPAQAVSSSASETYSSYSETSYSSASSYDNTNVDYGSSSQPSSDGGSW